MSALTLTVPARKFPMILNNKKPNYKSKPKTTLASSGLLLPELSALFTYLEENVSYENIRKKVVNDNILSKPSIQSSQVIWSKLSARYKFNDKDNLFQIWLELITQSEGYDLAQLCLDGPESKLSDARFSHPAIYRRA